MTRDDGEHPFEAGTRSPDPWKEAVNCTTHLIDRHGTAMGKAVRLAGDAHARLTTLFPILDSLCRKTCPGCPDPCCKKATVTFDHADLVFLHLTRQKVPPFQPRPVPGPPCRYLSPGGCLLPRAGRPWLCTWYLCPPQKSAMAQETARKWTRIVAEIKHARRNMEAAFILAIF